MHKRGQSRLSIPLFLSCETGVSWQILVLADADLSTVLQLHLFGRWTGNRVLFVDGARGASTKPKIVRSTNLWFTDFFASSTWEISTSARSAGQRMHLRIWRHIEPIFRNDCRNRLNAVVCVQFLDCVRYSQTFALVSHVDVCRNIQDAYAIDGRVSVAGTLASHVTRHFLFLTLSMIRKCEWLVWIIALCRRYRRRFCSPFQSCILFSCPRSACRMHFFHNTAPLWSSWCRCILWWTPCARWHSSDRTAGS
jgi:hypothetical protein